MLTKVQKNLEQLNILPGTEHSQVLIAAVSGGADSVCLLLVLWELRKRLGYHLEAIHVEHGIRGEESKEDAVFVENLCATLSVPCHVVHVDVPGFCKEQSMGEEEAARVLRYGAFSEYALLRGGKVVLAHHMEDQAETVIFQLLRGSSLAGLCGISPMREDENGVVYLRPLLNIRRSEIEAYLETAGQSYCTDSTNLETEYHRNYIRKEILPKMAEVNSAAVPHICRTAAQLTEVKDFLQEETKKAIGKLVTSDGKAAQTHYGIWDTKMPASTDAEGLRFGLRLDINGFRSLHTAVQKEVIYRLISKMAGSKKDITSTHVQEVLSLLSSQSGKQVILPYSVVVSRSFDTLMFEKKARQAGTSNVLESPGTVSEGLENVPEDSGKKRNLLISEQMIDAWKTAGLTVTVPLSDDGEGLQIRIFSYSGNEEEIPKKSYTKWFDYDKIKKGFCIRNRENGDFLVSDREGHHKKLKSYFIDEKIPQNKRNSMWLLAQDSHVLWLVGGRISEQVKVTKDTKTVFEIHYIGGN